MRKGFLGSIALVLASTGLAFAQPPSGDATTCGWASGEYILWFYQKPFPNPLLTTGSAATQGVLGAPDTALLFGATKLNDEGHHGGRITAGCWMCPDAGFEASIFFLDQRGPHLTAASDAGGNPVLARPFFNVLTGQQDRSLVSSPGAFAGSITINSPSLLWGAEGNFVWNPFANTCNWPELLVGFRYADLEEQLNIEQRTDLLGTGASNFLGAPLLAPNTLTVFDHIGVRNQFYGGQMGLRSRWDLPCGFYLDLTCKVALGETHAILNQNGTTGMQPPAGGLVFTTPGGLIVNTANSGRFVRDEFAVLGEAQLNIGFHLTCNIRTAVGYNFLYWSNVNRPGDQVDRNLNPSFDPKSALFGQASAPAAPNVLFRHSELSVHGFVACIALEF